MLWCHAAVTVDDAIGIGEPRAHQVGINLLRQCGESSDIHHQDGSPVR
jgi:hypothetical protein